MPPQRAKMIVKKIITYRRADLLTSLLSISTSQSPAASNQHVLQAKRVACHGLLPAKDNWSSWDCCLRYEQLRCPILPWAMLSGWRYLSIPELSALNAYWYMSSSR